VAGNIADQEIVARRKGQLNGLGRVGLKLRGLAEHLEEGLADDTVASLYEAGRHAPRHCVPCQARGG
jgi:hypothetical protein